ncbi:hypothetical protein PoB_004945700 [Plakobranchus ocellatus]|uniref:Uncharacterized protein n=1 Tax=Plakobranchus ocellatus TaxID=259542 RepID=A0AAV4BV85_9GAST|nr:hypothetical protein PoB_004945700 [Plakobranchus ocellatus]
MSPQLAAEPAMRTQTRENLYLITMTGLFQSYLCDLRVIGHHQVATATDMGAPVAQWIANLPRDLQFYSKFESYHWCPGLTEDLKA